MAQDSQGLIADRTREHLTATDVAIVRFRRLMLESNMTTRSITSILSLLSGSIKNGQPLPPYLKTLKPYELSEKLVAMDNDILSVRHINEPCYAALAVVQISSRCVIADLAKLLRYASHCFCYTAANEPSDSAMKEIVGEMDFSFHVISTASPAESTESLNVQVREKAKNE